MSPRRSSEAGTVTTRRVSHVRPAGARARAFERTLSTTARATSSEPLGFSRFFIVRAWPVTTTSSWLGCSEKHGSDDGSSPAARPDPCAVTLVTETYFPQVNGVSRTLGELARHLRECGDDVQFICPDYGTEVDAGEVYSRSRRVVLPFYKELHLPRPPFGRVHRAVAAFRPDIVHIATEATLGWSLLRYALKRGVPVVSSFHTNFDQYSGHYGVGWAKGLIWRYLRWFHNSTRETYVPSNATIRELRNEGFRAAGTVAARG